MPGVVARVLVQDILIDTRYTVVKEILLAVIPAKKVVKVILLALE